MALTLSEVVETPAALAETKAIILAAGKHTLAADGRPLVLQPLGDRAILDCVVENALGVVAPGDIYVVVGYRQEEVRAHLGDKVHYVFQEEPLGTGHAALQALPLLRDFHGSLLILYGDTPLFRPASIRGLLNRHRLRKADLTLLTAVVDRPLPYGRIVRDTAGDIVDIIEETEASASVREIREVNVGAYMSVGTRQTPSPPAIPSDGLGSRADPIGPARRELPALRPGRSAGHQHARRTWRTPNSFSQKRLFRPRRQEEANLVTFGTGGWRAIIGEGFTMHNVRRLSQALANGITRQGEEKRGVIVGYDRRFLSKQAAEAAAEVFAGQQHPHHPAERRRAHAADHLRHGEARIGVRPGVHGQPQSSGVERAEGLSRRWIAAARPRNARRSRTRPTRSIPTMSSSWNWTWRSRPASLSGTISQTSMWTRWRS